MLGKISERAHVAGDKNLLLDVLNVSRHNTYIGSLLNPQLDQEETQFVGKAIYKIFVALSLAVQISTGI